MLAELVIDKDQEDAFHDSGSGNALVNIFKSMARLGFENEKFLQIILSGQVQNFNELEIPWATMLFKELGEFRVENPKPILSALIQMSQPLHKKLKKGYEKKSTA